MSRVLRISALCLCVLAGSSATAFAQAAVTANGIKVGEGRIHPYFDLELRFDSAARFSTAGTALAELLMHFRPGVRLELPSQAVLLNLDANVDYVWYTGILSPGSQQLSRLQADASVDAAFNKTGTVEVDIGDHFMRSDRTTNAAIGVGVISLFNEARLAVPVHPGGGALEVAPGVAWAVEFFEPISNLTVPGCSDPTCTAAALAGMAYNNFHFDLDGRWRFLPKTALVVDTGFDFRTYANPAANTSAYLLRLEVGLAGLLTSKLALVAKLGWGHDLSARAATEPATAKTLIAHAELTYLMSDTSSIKAGYLRTLEPVPTFGVYGDDRGYVEARFLFAGRLTAHLYGAFDYLTFYASPTAPTGRNDSNATVDVGVDYQFYAWLIAGVGYDLSIRNSTLSVATLNYPRHEAYLRLTLTY